MAIIRCPKCHTTGDDQYGFCIRCGYEFSKLKDYENTCPLCGFANPGEADYCVKCGTPLIFKNHSEGNHTALNPIIIKRKISENAKVYNDSPKTSRLIIVLGYIFSILGGILGLVIAIYLATREDLVAKKHGYIQLTIFIFYLFLLVILFATGIITPDIINQYQQMVMENATNL